jgi:hypothetical protein
VGEARGRGRLALGCVPAARAEVAEVQPPDRRGDGRSIEQG